MEVYLIRHTSVNIAKGICYGMSDIDLAATYKEEIEKVCKKLQNENIEMFYSSPLKRCAILTNSISSNKNIIQDERLKEINFGNWELKEWNLIEKEPYFLEWSSNYGNLKAPNGESFFDLSARVNETFSEVKNEKYSRVGIITHGGVIRALLSKILQVPMQNSYTIGLDYGGISKIKINDAFSIVEYINR